METKSYEIKDESIRPDHGPTQIRTPEELQLEGKYIFHFLDVNGRPQEDSIVIKELPKKRNVTTFQYEQGIQTIQMESGVKQFGFKSKTIRTISLSDLSLIPRVHDFWEQNRWLEDPTKRKNGHPDQSPPNLVGKILKKLRP